MCKKHMMLFSWFVSLALFGGNAIAQTSSASASASVSTTTKSTTAASATTSVKKVGCASYAGLVDADNDGFCVFVGTSTAASTGFTGELDCDDEHKVRNPGAREIVDDGIDQDCSGSDLVLPVDPPTFERFVKGEYGGKTPNLVLFVTEYTACENGEKKTPPTCTIDMVVGRFIPTPGDLNAARDSDAFGGYLFADVYVNGTSILRNHGEASDGREVVSKKDYSHYKPSVKAARPTLTRQTVTTIARGEAIAAVGTEAGFRQAGDENLQGQINTIVGANAGRDMAINNLGDWVTTLSTDLHQENKEREDADTAESKERRDSDEALDTRVTAFENRPTPFVEGGPSFMLIGRKPLQQVNQDGEPNGEMVRNGALTAGVFHLRIGLETSSGEIAAFGNVAFGADGEGSGADSAYQIGLEALAGSSTLFGGFAAFQSTTDHTNSVDASVLDNGVLVGVSLNRDFMPGSGRITGYARVGLGYSWYGTKGTDANGTVVVPGSGLTGLLQIGVNFGAGASN